MKGLLLLFALVAAVSAQCDYRFITPMECYAKTGYLAPHYSYTLWDLGSTDTDGLQKIFDMAYCPELSYLRGNHFNGMVLEVEFGALGRSVFEIFTGASYKVLTDELSSQVLSFQKRFYTHDDYKHRSGINYWPCRHGQFNPMNIYISPAVQNHTYNSIKIDYEVEGNKPVIEKPLIDEVRQIPGTDLLLGKMYYRAFEDSIPAFVLWFALEKTSNLLPPIPF